MTTIVRLFVNLLWLLFSLLLTFLLVAGFLYLYIDSQLPDVEALKSVKMPIPMRIYTADGQLLAEFGELHRDVVQLKDVPPLIVQAFLAIEDRRFLEHHGIDPYGVARAVIELLLTGTKAQGASTITMQVARNFYLSREKTFMRKLVEMLLSLKIEKEFSKAQILELYFNKIFFGNRAYGIAAAAQVYYGKTLAQLTLPQIAMIAGLPKAPSMFNPFVNPIATQLRRDHVLTRMYELGYISQSAYQAAIHIPVTVGLQTPNSTSQFTQAPYVAEMVRGMIDRSFGDKSYTNGYHIYTTISARQQLAANVALRSAILAYDRRHGYRGAEGHFGSVQFKKNYLNTLKKIPIINGLLPALVTAVDTQTITVLSASGHVLTIFAPGWSWAAPSLAKLAHTGAKAIVHRGDIIRVEKRANDWYLAQLPKIQAALVALNPHNGAITALVGGFSYTLSQFNRVIQAKRQPGSGFKPFIYAATLAKGYTLASVFDDGPLAFDRPDQDEPWRPRNTNRRFNGPTRLRFALARSINLVTVRVLQAIGIPYTLNYLSRFGFNANELPHNLSLALGTGEVTPLELARSYAVFANGGYRTAPYLIDYIVNNQGQTIYKAQPKTACTTCLTDQPSPTQAATYAPKVIPADIAFLITSALKDVVRYGTGAAIYHALGRSDLAGKTGTTNDYLDTWFTGFNSDIVCSIWVGFDQPSSVKEYSARTAVPMWVDFMRVVLEGQSEHSMPQPPDVTTASIDPVTGEIVAEGTPGALLEYFQKDYLDQVAPTMLPPSHDFASNEPLF